MDLIFRLQEDQKDKKRVAVEGLLKKHFVKVGKLKAYHDDGSVDIDGDVELKHNYEGDELPVKFNDVSGHFSVSDTGLKRLSGAPKTSLKADISKTGITSLVGIPQTTLGFHASGLKLADLTGIRGTCKNILLDDTELRSLKGAPADVPGKFRFSAKELKNLDGLPGKIGELIISNIPKDFPLLRVLLSDVKTLTVSNFIGIEGNEAGKIQAILKKHLGEGRKGALDAQRELMDAGFGDYSRVA